MQLKENYPLNKITTMRVGGPARFLVKIKDRAELRKILDWTKERQLPILIVGGGSNLVVNDKGFDGVVVVMKNKGRQVIKENKQAVWLRVEAGEVLDELVKYTVANNWWGLENLSFIPGTVAGLIIQNGGAYGREIGELVEKVEVYDLKEAKIKTISASACGFAYRRSIFNSQFKGRYVILSAVLKLSKARQANLGYKDLELYFKQRRIKEPGLTQVRRALIKIRKNKLPDWHKIGSAGSFFKNLFLGKSDYACLLDNLKANFSQREVAQLEMYKKRFSKGQQVKIPTAWLLDICGLKGLKVGAAAVYKKQPLVIVNLGKKATAQDIMRLFRNIRRKVFKLTGMVLEPEPQLVGFNERELVKYFSLD